MKLMNVKEVADALGVSARWVWNHTVTGELPSYKLGRRRLIDEADVKNWLQKFRVKVEPAEPSRRSDSARKNALLC